ncbi:hypothetical protein DPEC_G00090200 [Dallia pectoralis]|uniref:Uncharacterized protein n=1 Tax=Dallia pectoralis TaxID=75939 RepID=A0ACC2H1K9_DALPE|nr:hypothetical protein DPEC_G00090200 [Dallia pectoralis]
MNATQISPALRMDQACNYLLKPEDLLRFPAFNRVPLDNASTTATSQPLVFPSLGQHIQASAEEKEDKLLQLQPKFHGTLGGLLDLLVQSRRQFSPPNQRKAHHESINLLQKDLGLLTGVSVTEGSSHWDQKPIRE